VENLSVESLANVILDHTVGWSFVEVTVDSSRVSDFQARG